MPDVESTSAGQQPRSNAWQSAVTVVQQAEPAFIPAGAHAMTIVVEFPPGDPGTPPHRHPGPAFGYVLDGEMVFELEGEPARVVRAGEAFWEPGGDVIHYQDGNNRDDIPVEDHEDRRDVRLLLRQNRIALAKGPAAKVSGTDGVVG